jgi:organic radical activating enzyme
LARCNLTCSYCDTPYTWDFERYSFDDEVHVHDPAVLVEWLLKACPGRLIVTGGEPLVQQRPLEQLLIAWRADLARAVGSGGQVLPFVEVETNGTILPRAGLAALIGQWNVSPKLAVSGEPQERRIKASVLEWFARAKNAYFKFVVTSEADVDEALGLAESFDLPRDRLLLMPEARTSVELRLRSPAVASWALSRRVRFTGRLHLELYGGRRGT